VGLACPPPCALHCMYLYVYVRRKAVCVFLRVCCWHASVYILCFVCCVVRRACCTLCGLRTLAVYDCMKEMCMKGMCVRGHARAVMVSWPPASPGRAVNVQCATLPARWGAALVLSLPGCATTGGSFVHRAHVPPYRTDHAMAQQRGAPGAPMDSNLTALTLTAGPCGPAATCCLVNAWQRGRCAPCK
jgi:hypothetical protein